MQSVSSIELIPLGDSAIVVQFGQTINLETHRKVRALAAYLDRHPFPGMVEYIPAFTTVSVFYDPCRTNYRTVCFVLEQIVSELVETQDLQPRTVEIPVLYGGEFGPDLEFVAEHNGLTTSDVIEIHSSGEYLVYMIGFAPGFPYIGGMSERIATPRRPSPRLSIPAGTVGIAGMQTGVYPIETPGGWQLIGRTPIALFRPDDNPPSLLQAGDIVRFRPISREEYKTWKEDAR
ncbi:5-oxoprolinase subunit PxpB [Effusibacillus lacus]|uniref:Kinase inhibitor n=1 Tax=Effusibacillus lacus TaxID=1348429 RepID=A0A292YST6_9BACL|nr:5-oxoprolinase subunit PxpB [Effusibacillus lacus]TCS70394.1 inhibitor of KinA [Effusibacillus lacus]GAX91545.1 kinase inhibitor [Effusibacillus lacus]